MFNIGQRVYRVGRNKVRGVVIKIMEQTPGGNWRASDGNVYHPSGKMYKRDKNRTHIKPLTRDAT
jgi:hypothetical protein